jgi:type VI secretion system protein ImpJ
MKSLSQVVWSEGMYLGPHEFQAQTRFFEDSIHFAARALWFECYGLIAAALDPEALYNGTVCLNHASGIFPDGTPFRIPQSDAIPDSRLISEHFPPVRENLTIYLAIPERTPQGRNCALSEGASDARYTAELRDFNDETTGGDMRPVRIGRKNIRVLLETEPMEGVACLPLARVKRDGSGRFIYDPEFVPPCLQISASERLMLLLGRLIEILEAKSTALARPAPGGTAEPSSQDIASLWLRHAVNTALAALRHLWISKRGHPEELFLEMSRLGGALCTFALDSHPRSLPAYDHRRLGECFDALDRHIRANLETIVPTRYVAIPLNRVADCLFEGEIADTRCLGRSRWILGVRARVGEAELILKVPQLIKICSAKFVGELVRRAIAGLGLMHVPVAPPGMPARVEMQYFGISREGPFWDHIVQTKRIGIYVPGELAQPELELLVLLDK